MQVQGTDIAGLFLIIPKVIPDVRGFFAKIFHAETFQAAKLRTDFRETYYSLSHENVIRGMHFQTPPHDHAKLVYVPTGRIQDVVLDLRKSSPTFGQHFSVQLDSSQGVALYVPQGCAHGFCSLESQTIVTYMQTSEYAPSHDRGIRYDSFGCRWKNNATPIMSERDLGFPEFTAWESPF